jgi:hypothetical protein
MTHGQRRYLVIIPVILACIVLSGMSIIEARGDINFSDDFEQGTAKWELLNPHRIKIMDSGDPKHGNVLVLRPGGPGVIALIKNSHNWTNIRFESDVYFPFHRDHNMQFVYNYNAFDNRVDFGSIFLYGPYGTDADIFYRNYREWVQFPPGQFLGNVAAANPHRDANASRVLYPESWVVITGEPAVEPGEWGRFKAEVIGPVCHFYVTDMKTPKLTFEFHEYSSGMVGFKARYAGAEFWVDNIKVTSIKEFSYKGPPLPAGRNYKPEKLITRWDAIGPFSNRMKEIEETDGYSPGKTYLSDSKELKWKPFDTDPRGCVAAGRIVERFNAKFYVYFHTELDSKEKRDVTLQFNSTSNLIVWLNSKMAGGIMLQHSAWYDFWENPKRIKVKQTLTLNPGKNHIVILLSGDRYGGDGFFACCNMEEESK